MLNYWTKERNWLTQRWGWHKWQHRQAPLGKLVKLHRSNEWIQTILSQRVNRKVVLTALLSCLWLMQTSSCSQSLRKTQRRFSSRARLATFTIKKCWESKILWSCQEKTRSTLKSKWSSRRMDCSTRPFQHGLAAGTFSHKSPRSRLTMGFRRK